jgi:hypothetical protein
VNCNACDAVIRLETGCNPTLQGQPTRFICNTPEMIRAQLAAPTGSSANPAATASGTASQPASAASGTRNADIATGASAGVGLLSLLAVL